MYCVGRASDEATWAARQVEAELYCLELLKVSVQEALQELDAAAVRPFNVVCGHFGEGGG